MSVSRYGMKVEVSKASEVYKKQATASLSESSFSKYSTEFSIYKMQQGMSYGLEVIFEKVLL